METGNAIRFCSPPTEGLPKLVTAEACETWDRGAVKEREKTLLAFRAVMVMSSAALQFMSDD